MGGHLPAQSVSKMRSAWVPWFRIVLRLQSPFTSFEGRAEVTSWRRFPPTQPQSGCHRCCSFFLCVWVWVWVWVWVFGCVSVHYTLGLHWCFLDVALVSSQGKVGQESWGSGSAHQSHGFSHIMSQLRGIIGPAGILPVLQGQ